MKYSRQIYASVRHFDSSTDKSQVVLFFESLIVWLICFVGLVVIRSNRHKLRTKKFSVHTLVSHLDVPFYIIAICSFHRFLQKNPNLIVYDDGTLTADDYRIITQLPSISVITYTKANLLATRAFGAKNILLATRLHSPYNRKLIDPLLYKRPHEKILLLDSDVIFFRNPSRLIMFLTSDVPKLDIAYIQDIHNAYIASVPELNQVFRINCTPRLNSGVLGFRADMLTESFVADYYHTLRTTFGQKPLFEPWIEQTGYAVLASTVKTKPLPREYSVGKKYDRTTICKHYVHGNRTTYAQDLVMLMCFNKSTK
jgi:hypothetical protein